MNWEQARLAISGAFITAWSAAHSTVPYYFKGKKLPDLKQVSSPFIKVRIYPMKTEQSGLMGSTPPKRRHGRVVFEIFSPDTTGDSVLFGMLATLEANFSATSVSGVVFRNLVPSDPIPGVGWENRPIQSFFYFD